MQTFQDVISAWGTVAAFAKALGVKERTAMSWWQRGSIPAPWFRAVARAAASEGGANLQWISVELLAEIAERRRLAGEAARRRKQPGSVAA